MLRFVSEEAQIIKMTVLFNIYVVCHCVERMYRSRTIRAGNLLRGKGLVNSLRKEG